MSFVDEVAALDGEVLTEFGQEAVLLRPGGMRAALTVVLDGPYQHRQSGGGGVDPLLAVRDTSFWIRTSVVEQFRIGPNDQFELQNQRWLVVFPPQTDELKAGMSELVVRRA